MAKIKLSWKLATKLWINWNTVWKWAGFWWMSPVSATSNDACWAAALWMSRTLYGALLLAGHLALPPPCCKDPWLARAGFRCHLKIMERGKYFYPATSWQLVIIVPADISAVVIVLGHSLSPWITSCCLNCEPSLENILKCPVNTVPFFFFFFEYF